eukprot:TRINITY_DN2359_c1_g1_i1.p1 TRINITY_DN2359_c1_g1~~TRINITY_DN2359_c1_g1_i1.p1  ORF type:complete len:136 (+),score=27.75 TRINITY_DN2359_c1_g1_i1:506-913(+)
MAAQQLLLDTHALKTVLLALPEFASRVTPSEIKMTSSVQRYLKKEMNKAETLLKVIQTPIQGILENYMALVPEHTLANFQKILDLKGLKKSEQAPLLAEYTRYVHTPHLSLSLSFSLARSVDLHSLPTYPVPLPP